MYTFSSRVRYSETDEEGKLSVLGIMNYMQDCSTMQSEDARVGIGYLGSRHKAWLLSSWRIDIDRYPRLGENLTVGTWPTDFKGIYGYRDFALMDKAGNAFVKAHSVWFLYDTQSALPIRVQPEDALPYGDTEPPLAVSDSPRKLPVPAAFSKDTEEKQEIVIADYHLDTNHHVNNAMYVEMAREAIPHGLKMKAIRADYKKAARLGDIIVPRITEETPGTWTVVLGGREKEVYAVVQLLTQQC
jgi:acyl-ACP thioesterase